jgi:hypothetical protein
MNVAWMSQSLEILEIIDLKQSERGDVHALYLHANCIIIFSKAKTSSLSDFCYHKDHLSAFFYSRR